MDELVSSLGDCLNSSESGSIEHLEDGQVLYRQGDKCNDIFWIESGYLKFERVDANGSNAVTAILNSGQPFGPGLARRNTAEQTVCAKGVVSIRRYSQSTFQMLIEHNPGLSETIITLLALRVEINERRLQAILTLDVPKRIVRILQDLAGHYGGRCSHGHEVDVPLTQQEIAELAGASRPVVSAQLNLMRRKGLLSYNRDYICLHSLAAMRAEAAVSDS